MQKDKDIGSADNNWNLFSVSLDQKMKPGFNHDPIDGIDRLPSEVQFPSKNLRKKVDTVSPCTLYDLNKF